METIKKKVSHILTTENGALFLEIELRQNGKMQEWSFVWVEWPRRNGNWEGSCGQCIELFPPRIQKLWNKYHLNGISAGTKEQDEYIKALKSKGWEYDYTQACEELKKVWLYEVTHEGKPYKYGHSWIYHANPSSREIHDFFESLVDNSDIYPWKK